MKTMMLTLAALALAVGCASTDDKSTTKNPTTAAASSSSNVASSHYYSAEAGPIAVGVIPVASLHDAARNKDLGLSIEYPTKAGSYPVIVFSPAYGGTAASYEPLASFWTSNGYVVIRLSHADADPTAGTTRAQLRGGANGGEDLWTTQHETEWRNRARDISFVLDSFDRLESEFPELKGKMDRARIAVAGHAYGAFTALLVGGLRTAGGMPVAMKDARVKAVVAMAPPPLGGAQNVAADSWRELTEPVMLMAGVPTPASQNAENNDRRRGRGRDSQQQPATPAPPAVDPAIVLAEARQPFDAMPAGDKYFVALQGARPSSFTGVVGLGGLEDLPARRQGGSVDPWGGNYPGGYGGNGAYGRNGQDPRRGGMTNMGAMRLTSAIRVGSLAFFDTYLKNDAKGRDYLRSTPNRFEEQNSGRLTITTK